MIFDIENSTAGIKSRLSLTQFARIKLFTIQIFAPAVCMSEISIYNHLNICFHSALFVAFYCFLTNFTEEELNVYEHCRMIRLL